MLKIIIIVCLLMLGGCRISRQSRSDMHLTEYFTNQDTIYAHPLHYEGSVFSLGLADSLLIISSRGSEQQIEVFNPHSGKVATKFGRIGKGPNEFILDPCYFNQFEYRKDSLCFWFFDLNSRKFRLFNLDRISNLKEPEFCEMIIVDPQSLPESSVFHLNDSTLIGTSGSNNGQVFIYNAIQGEHNFFDFYKDTRNKTNNTGGSLLSCSSGLKPDKTMIASAFAFYEIINIYSSSGELTISIPPEKSSKHKHDFLENNKPNNEIKHIFYYDLYTTNDFIFALYINCSLKQLSEGNFLSEIHVFDWHGNPIIRYFTSCPIECFVVDEKIGKGYGSHFYTPGSLSVFNLPLLIDSP